MLDYLGALIECLLARIALSLVMAGLGRCSYTMGWLCFAGVTFWLQQDNPIWVAQIVACGTSINLGWYGVQIQHGFDALYKLDQGTKVRAFLKRLSVPIYSDGCDGRKLCVVASRSLIVVPPRLLRWRSSASGACTPWTGQPTFYHGSGRALRWVAMHMWTGVVPLSP